MRTLERIVVATNVFVSGLLRQFSVPGQAAARARRDGIVLVSQATMAELADVLSRAKFDRYVAIEQRVQFIRLVAHIAEFVPIVQAVCECRDPADDKFLEAALNGRADLIVTGDKQLLAMNPWRGIAILSPDNYVKR